MALEHLSRPSPALASNSHVPRRTLLTRSVPVQTVVMTGNDCTTLSVCQMATLLDNPGRDAGRLVKLLRQILGGLV